MNLLSGIFLNDADHNAYYRNGANRLGTVDKTSHAAFAGDINLRGTLQVYEWLAVEAG